MGIERDVKDMTEAEICSMTEEDVERAVRFRWMDLGIPLTLPPVPDEVLPPSIEPDVTAYCVFGYMYESREIAEQISLLASKALEFEIECDYRVQGPLRDSVTGRRYGDHPVTIKKLVSAESKSVHERTIELHSKTDDARQKARAARDTIEKEQNEARAAVMQRINEVRGLETKREHWRSEITTYLGLTNGDGEIAERFFTKAYPKVLVELPELREMFSPAPAPRVPRH